MGRPVGSEHDAGDPLAVRYDLVLPYTGQRGRLRPLVRIGVQIGDGVLQTLDALVDTGADACVLDGSIALDAGIDPRTNPGEVITVSGFAGSTIIRAYVHRVTLYLGSSYRFRTLTTNVAFTDPADPAAVLRTSVLGHRGFLDRVRFGVDGTVMPPHLFLGFPPARDAAGR